MSSRKKALYAVGRYMQLIKSLEYHLSGRWSRCKGGRYIERSLT